LSQGIVTSHPLVWRNEGLVVSSYILNIFKERNAYIFCPEGLAFQILNPFFKNVSFIWGGKSRKVF